MISAFRAMYDALTDMVQVAIVVQDDNGTSIADEVKSGFVDILHYDTTMHTIPFSAENKVLWYEPEDEDVVPEDQGQFYCFLMHPQVQHHMNAKVTAEFHDGTTLVRQTPVEVSQEVEPEALQNPALSGRAAIVFEKTTDVP